MSLSTTALPGPAVASRPRFYRPELDVLRFFAFLMVFLHHAIPESKTLFGDFRYSLAFGVCLFFLLSAYLITELLELEANATRTIRLGAFYVRRILRIWPLYIAILLIDYFVPHPDHPHAFGAARLAAYLLLVGNWYCYFFNFAFTLSLPLWSISIEEQFYLLWPSARKFLRRRGAIAFSIAMFLTSYVTLFLLGRWQVDVDVKVWVNSFVQFQFFSLGALLAFTLGGKPVRIPAAVRLLMFAAALGLLTVSQAAFQAKFSAHPATFRLLGPGFLCVDAACLLLFLSFLGASSLGRFTWLTYLGKISYGLYAFHAGALLVAAVIVRHVVEHAPGLAAASRALSVGVALALTIAIAAASYRFFEMPFLKLKHRFEAVRTRPD